MQGLPHGPRPPPHVPVQTLSKPPTRSLTSATPLHPNSSHSNATFSYLENNSSSSVNASRTSSFAAALRKLAKQAVDPVPEREMSPARSPAQQSSGSKQLLASSVYMSNNHTSLSSVPITSASSISNHSYTLERRKEADLGRYSASSNSNSSHGLDAMSYRSEYPKSVSSREDGRNGNLLDINPSSSLYASHQRLSTPEEHGTLPHGFQSFMNSEDSRISTSSQMYEPPSSVSAGYPSTFPPISISQQYRLDDSMYIDRYGMVRAPSVSYPSSSNILPYPSVPFYPGSRYTPELLTQSLSARSSVTSAERSKSVDDVRDEDSLTLRERRFEEERDHEINREREQREHSFNESLMDVKGHRIYSPLALQITKSESPLRETSRMESIAYGGSRDLLLRKQSPPSSSVPLNLVKHSVPSSYQDESSSSSSSWNSKIPVSSSYPAYGNILLHKNGYDSRVRPPPLISESHRDMQHQKNVQVAEDTANINIPMPIYRKPTASFLRREYPKSNTPPQYSDDNPHINGLASSEMLDYRFHEKHSNSNHKYFRDSYRQITENHSDKELLVKSEVSPPQHSWESRAYSERFQRPVVRDENPHRTNTSYSEFADKEYAVNASMNNAQQFSPKETSITRALLQNHITPSIIERYIQSSEEPGNALTSKLDLRERRLRKRRIMTSDPDYELSDSEADEADELKMREFMIITKGRPLPVENCPEKVSFLKMFRLATYPEKQLLEWKKFLRRRRILKEKSCSPEPDENSSLIPNDPKRLEELSKRLCIEDNSQAKDDFMRLLNLAKKSEKMTRGPVKPSDPDEAKEVQMKIMCAIENMCDDQRYSKLPESHVKKRRTLLSGMQPNRCKKMNSLSGQMNGIISSDRFDLKKSIPSLKPLESLSIHAPSFPSTSSPLIKISPNTKEALLPPLIPAEQCVPSAGGQPLNSSKTITSSLDPRVKLLTKKFAQEFHESVLQATQMQLGQKISSSCEEPTMPNITPSVEEESQLLGEKRTTLKWPGIEVIMESYDCYILEQNVEKEFLVERCQQLRTTNQELNNQIVCLGKKTTNLVQQKNYLDSEKQKVQVAIDRLKSLIHNFR